MSSPAAKTQSSPPKHSPYTLHPTYSGTIPAFFDCQSSMQQGLMGIVITFMKETNHFEAVKEFAKCLDPTKKGSYKHMVRVCMGRDHLTDFAKLSISRLCGYQGCGNAKEHPVFPMSDDERQECLLRFCRWLMSTNEIAKLRAMKKCIAHLQDNTGQLRALDEEITTVLAQSEATLSSALRPKRKRNSTESATPSKYRKVSEGSSKATPLTIKDDDDDEVEFVESTSKPLISKISRKASSTPVAGPSTLGETPGWPSHTEHAVANPRWMRYLSHVCDELEEAVNGDGMGDAILGPKLRALAQTIYNNC